MDEGEADMPGPNEDSAAQASADVHTSGVNGGKPRAASKLAARLEEKCARVIRPLLDLDEILEASFPASNQRAESYWSQFARKTFIIGVTNRRIVVVQTNRYLPYRPKKEDPRSYTREQLLGTEEKSKRKIQIDGQSYWIHAFYVPVVAAADQRLG